MDVFSMLAHQSGIYVRLKIHTILHQSLNPLLVAADSSLVWVVLQLLVLYISTKHA